MAEALPEPLDFYEAWIEADKYEALQNQPVEPAAAEQEPCEAAAETGEAAAADIARHGDPYEKLFEDGDPEDLDVKEEKEDDLSDYQLSKKMRVAMDGHFKIMLPRPKIRGRPKEETPSNPTEPMKEEAQSTEGTKVELGSGSATEPSSPTAVPQEGRGTRGTGARPTHGETGAKLFVPEEAQEPPQQQAVPKAPFQLPNPSQEAQPEANPSMPPWKRPTPVATPAQAQAARAQPASSACAQPEANHSGNTDYQQYVQAYHNAVEVDQWQKWLDLQEQQARMHAAQQQANLTHPQLHPTVQQQLHLQMQQHLAAQQLQHNTPQVQQQMNAHVQQHISSQPQQEMMPQVQPAHVQQHMSPQPQQEMRPQVQPQMNAHVQQHISPPPQQELPKAWGEDPGPGYQKINLNPNGKEVPPWWEYSAAEWFNLSKRERWQFLHGRSKQPSWQYRQW